MSTIAYKERAKPRLLDIYEALYKRMKLSNDDYQYYMSLKKGFEGECRFDDEYTDALDSHSLVLNDLLLKHNRSIFQIDSLVICSDRILLFEVKNYQGVHHWGPVTFTKTTGTTLENPTLQLQKTRARLEILLAALKIQMRIEAYIAYVNPEFTLLGAQRNEDYLLPSQLPHYFKTLQLKGKLEPEQSRLADMLKKLHNPDNFVDEMPEFCYEKLHKELVCSACGSAVHFKGGKSVLCPVCKKKSSARKIIKQNVEEFRLLFPNEKVTTSRIADWCGVANKDCVYRILKSNYRPIGKGQGRYYV